MEAMAQSLKEVGGESKGTYESVNSMSEQSGSRRTSFKDRHLPQLHKSTLDTTHIMNQEDVHNRLMKTYKDAPLS